MSYLDVDAILQAQSSDDEDEEETTEIGPVDTTDVLDSRLEDILNAAEEEDEPDASSSSHSKLHGSSLGGVSTTVQAGNKDDSTPFPQDSFDTSISGSHGVPSNKRASTSPVRPSSSPSAISKSPNWNSDTLQDHNQFNKDGSGPPKDSRVSEPGVGYSSVTSMVETSCIAGMQSRRALHGTTQMKLDFVDQDSPVQSSPISSGSSISVTRPGAAVAAASRQVSIPSDHESPTELIPEGELVPVIEDLLQKHDQISSPCHSHEEEDNVKEHHSGSEILSGNAKQTVDIEPCDSSMGKDELVLMTKSSIEAGQSEPNTSESEDDTLFTNHTYGSNSTQKTDYNNLSSANSWKETSSEDDSDREEILSLLSNEILLSEKNEHNSSTGYLTSNTSSSEKSVNKVSSRDGEIKKKHAQSQQSTLDRAEEAEKKAAFSAMHMEEGAAAQPMRLEGIQAAPPAIGYLSVDNADSVSQVFASSTIFRDHGTAQALAVHGNSLAVGFSKGNVFILPVKSSGAKFGDSDTKPTLLNSSEKAHASVTSLGFNMQGDLLLVGHANGYLALWELSSRGATPRPINAEHSAAIIHTTFLCTKHQKAISADCKGLVLLINISWGAFGRYSVTTQCLLDGQNTGMVLCVSPLLLDDDHDSANTVQSSSTTATSTVLTSMVGGMVRGVVAGKSSDLVKRTSQEGATTDEAGNMVVFVTHQSINVVRLPPFLEKCAMLPRPEGIRDGGIPYIAWRRVRTSSPMFSRGSSGSTGRGLQAGGGSEVGKITSEEQERVNHPLLALAWDRKIFTLQLLKGELKIIFAWDLDCAACGVTWLDEQILAVLTSKEQICLFTKEGMEIERVNIENSKTNNNLTYHTHILNTFGNPEKTYYNVLATQSATMYLLGPSRVWRARLLLWHERIKSLESAGDWMSAFHLGMEVYDGRSIAVVGLPRKKDLLQKAVIPVLLDLLYAYVDEAFTYLALAFGTTASATETSSNMHDPKTEAREQYARVGGVAIEFCVHIKQTEILFDRIYNRFCSAGQQGTFLELLEPYILKDTLGALAPEVMQGLVEYYSQKGWVQRVERCVLHMDIASLDFNQVVRLCRDHELYSALIYLFNKGLDDYKSPMEELLIAAQDTSKPNAQALGYKLLVYLKYCFLGLAFPPGHGEIPYSRLPTLRSELLQCLLDGKPLPNRQSSHKSMEFQFTIHPRLSYLLSFDLMATLEVLHCAFRNDGSLEILKEHNIEGDGSMENETKNGLQLLQEMVDALSDILERIRLYSLSTGKPHKEKDAWRLHVSKVDAGFIMEFIAHYVVLNLVKIPRVLLDGIIEYLTSNDKKFKKVEDVRRKEAILVKLLNAVPESEWNSAQVLELALRAQFWQASACLLARKGDYVAALDSYMKDKDKPENAFLYILDVLNPEKGLREDKLYELRSSILARLPQLLQLSSESTLVIILKHFSKEHKLILSDLAPYPPLLFQYLKQIMNARSGYKHSNLQSTTSTTSVDEDHTSNQLVGIEGLQDLIKNVELDFTNDMEELYVELLCQFEPESVLSFLKSFENYRLEHCLKLCQDHRIKDAAAYLLERVGDIASALSLVLADIDHHMQKMDLSVARLSAQRLNVKDTGYAKAEQFLNIQEVAVIHSVMQAAIGLCQRNTWRMYPGESEALWFRLLDRFIDPLQKLHNARRDIRKKRANRFGMVEVKEKEHNDSGYKWKVVMIGRKAVELMQKVLVYLIGEIVNGMMGYVPLSAIMDKLLSDNGRHEFGDFKGTILQMLELYGYEQTILHTAKHVVEDDLFHNISICKKNATRGYRPDSLSCCACKHKLDDNGSGKNVNGLKGKASDVKGSPRPLSSGFKSIIVFPCGHPAHSSCIFPDVGMSDLRWDVHVATCPICPSKMGQNKAHRKLLESDYK